MKEITRIDIWSLSKVLFIVGVVIGLLNGIVTLIGGKYGLLPPGMIVDGKVLISAPLVYGISLLILGAIFVLVYNFIAGKIGGFKIEIK